MYYPYIEDFIDLCTCGPLRFYFGLVLCGLFINFVKQSCLLIIMRLCQSLVIIHMYLLYFSVAEYMLGAEPLKLRKNVWDVVLVEFTLVIF